MGLFDWDIPDTDRFSCIFDLSEPTEDRPAQLRGWTIRHTDSDGYREDVSFGPDGYRLDEGSNPPALPQADRCGALRWIPTEQIEYDNYERDWWTDPLPKAGSRWKIGEKREWQRNPSSVGDLFERDVRLGCTFSCAFQLDHSTHLRVRLAGWTIRRTDPDGSFRECCFDGDGQLESIQEMTMKQDGETQRRDFSLLLRYAEDRVLQEVQEDYYCKYDLCYSKPYRTGEYLWLRLRFDPEGKSLGRVEQWENYYCCMWDMDSYDYDADGNLIGAWACERYCV